MFDNSITHPQEKQSEKLVLNTVIDVNNGGLESLHWSLAFGRGLSVCFIFSPTNGTSNRCEVFQTYYLMP